MRKSYFFLWVFLLFYGVSGVGYGQQAIGSFPVMDGGFENQSGTLGNTLSNSGWSRQSGTGSTINSSGGRSGPKFVSATVSASTRLLQSPQDGTASNGPAASTAYVVQFYYKSTSNVANFQIGVSVNGTSNPTYSTAATLNSTSGVWTKYVGTVTTPSNSITTAGIGILRGGTSASGGPFDVDDFVIYAGSSADNTVPNSPTAVVVNNPSTSSLDVSWTAASGGVDGGGYVVVRYATSPNADNDPNQNGIYAVGNTITNGTGSLTGTVRYIGTGTSFTDNSGLSAGTTYYYKVYTVDKAFNYSAESQGSGTTSSDELPTISVTPTSLTGFNYAEGSGPSSSQTYSLSGTNLTPASGDLTVTGSTNFEVSTDNSSFGSSRTVSYSGGALTSTTIYVRLKSGLTAGAYNSETIANSGGGATTVNVTASGSVSVAEPTTQASNVTFSSVSTTGFTINWTSGNGSKRLIVVKSGSAVDTDPTDGVTYTANAAFGSGTQIGTGNYVVYNDNGSSVAVTGLTSGTTYHVAVYEYNGGSGSENYRTADKATGSQATTVPTVDGIALYEFYNEPASAAGATGGVTHLDWNGGGFNTSQDEFIEFVNTTASSVDVSGWIISDGNSWAVKLPVSTTIPAYGFLVLGNTQGTFLPNENTVFVDVDAVSLNFDGSWSLANAGEVIFLINPGTNGTRGGGDDTWLRYRLDGAADDTDPFSGTNTGSSTLAGTNLGVLDLSSPGGTANLSLTITPQGSPLSASIAVHNATNFQTATNNVSPGTRADGYFAFITLPVISTSLSSLSSFGNVAIGNQSSALTYTVSGDDLTSSVTVEAPTHFEVSTDGASYSSSVDLNQSGGNLTGEPVTIYVRLNPASAVGSVSGNITHTATGATTKNIAVSGNTLAAEPTTSSTVSFDNITATSITVNFTGGNGSKRIVIAKQGSEVTYAPSDASSVSGANSDFSLATDLGSGNKIIYNDNAASVSVTNLLPATTYHFAVYEYNEGTGTSQNYRTTAGTGNQSTLPPSIALSSPSQVTAGNIIKGSDDNVISQFQMAVTDAEATLTEVSVPLGGTYLAADIKTSGLKLWYNSSNTFSGASQLGTSQSSASEGTGETINFSSLSQNISASSTGYFFVTASIANDAADEKTIYAAAMSTANFTVSVGNKSGSTTQGGTQTITPNPAPTITVSASPALTEENLNGAVVTVSLTNVEFADDQFDVQNFSLNNAPTGVTIGALEYLGTTSAACTLAYDGADFDANVTTFSITILDGEFSGSPGNLTSDNLTITATVEVVPTVTTNEAITSKSSTSAVWGGEATATGGESVTVKGIVWSTSASPTVELETKTTEGAGLGAITGNMTSLSPNTTYYVRAYATNSVGTGYGTERSFTTDGLGTPPTASAATNITSTGFTANWGSVSGASSYRLDVATDENFTSNTILSENFVGFTTNNGTTDRSGSLNTYLQTTGWTGTAIYEMIGYAKLGAGSTRGVITTPTVDLSGNSGNHILEFDLGKFGTDNTSVEVYHAPDGTTFAQVGTDIVAPASITTQTVQISGGTAASKLRIQANLASSNRFYLDNFIVKTSTILTSHNNKEVNGTSENVSGLSSGTTYYYRVRGFSANSTSGNSGVITVRTADNSQSASVSTGNNVSAPVNGATGVEEVLFTSVATGGNINVARFNEPPTGGTSGITGNISQYRLIIEPDNVLVFDEQAGYKLRFKASDLPGITTRPENLNTTSVRLHKRSTPGSGDFSAAITMTYYRNEDPALDYLESDLITNGFSEFIFSSPDQPLPVELVSFTAKVKSSAVQLQWETATEVNNYGFEVERSNAAETMNASSTQGRTWQKIGFVEGNGNSNSPKSYSFTDRNASAGKYIYRLKQVDTDGAFDYSDEVAVDLGTPAQFSLSQNYPNPFNPSTLVQYAVPVQSVVVLEIYDITGTRVAQPVNALHEPGSYSALFNLTDLNLASGTYIYRLSATDMSGKIMYSAINKMLLLK